MKSRWWIGVTAGVALGLGSVLLGFALGSLIALPFDMPPGTPIAVRAEDEAGNVATRGIPAEIKPAAIRMENGGQ